MRGSREKMCDAMGSTWDLSYVQLMEVLLPGKAPYVGQSSGVFLLAFWSSFLGGLLALTQPLGTPQLVRRIQVSAPDFIAAAIALKTGTA